MKTYIALFLIATASIVSAQNGQRTPSRLDPPSLNRDTHAADAAQAKARADIVGTWDFQGSRGWKGVVTFLANGKFANGAGTWSVRGSKLICDYGGGRQDVFNLPKDGVMEGTTFKGTTMKGVKQGFVKDPPKTE